MDIDAIVNYISRTFMGTQRTEASGNLFFSYAPDANVHLSGWTPFATLVVNDASDRASRLNRPSIFRLNIGIKPDTYREMFGKQPAFARGSEVAASGHDFTALDQLMPHPIYAPMFWVCVLNPSEKTFRTVEPLLEEAYQTAVRRYEKQTGAQQKTE